MTPAVAHEIGSLCLGLHIRRAARRLTRHYDLALAPVDLTIGQFSLLTLLAGQDRWDMQPLADALGTDRSSLTAALKPLERRRLVESLPDPDDRRRRYLGLTPAGAALLDAAHSLWRVAQRAATEQLGETAATDLRKTLKLLA